MKRLLDIVVTASLLLLAGPCMLVVIVLVRIFDGSPVFFSQTRVGKNGCDFQILKFRTMAHRPPTDGAFDAGDSSRVTRLGKLLRKTKLDELPQLINVLRGEMSLVGPRPEVRKWVDTYPQRWAEILKVRPGITDPASIEFRNEEELLAKAEDAILTYRTEILPRKLSLYEEYVRSQSTMGDFAILVQTLLAIVRR